MDDTLLNRTKCPVKLADLIACGVPVVAEAVGQVPEYVVSDHNGWLRPQGDVAGLVEKTVTLLQDKDLQRRMARQARTHYRTHFSWDSLAERLLHTYAKQ
jgi:glycosyltransferase involved in cell wall biosynthesis